MKVYNRLKISLEGLNSILKLADGNISKLESKRIEIMQSGEQRERKGENDQASEECKALLTENIYIYVYLYT